MFDGFSAEDFDAYLPEKWSSNVFTLPRRKVKEKLDFIGKRLFEDFRAYGLSLTMHLSDDHPSLWNKKKVDTQWLFFSRDEEARKKLAEIIDTERTLADTLTDPTPLYRHVFLGVSVNHEQIEVGIRLHHEAWVDRKNLAALLNDDASRAQFDEIRGNLPEDFEIGAVGSDSVSLRELNSEQVGGLVQEFDKEKGWLFLGFMLKRDAAMELAGGIVDRIVEYFTSLIAVYRFVAWAPSNDAISVDSIVARRKQEKIVTQEQHDRERVEREERRREEEAERVRLRREAEERTRDDQAWRERERAFRKVQAQRAAAQVAKEGEGDGERAAPVPKETAPAAVEVQAKAVESPQDPKPEKTDRPAERRAKGERSGGGGAKPPRESGPVSAPVSKVSAQRKAEIQVGDGVIVQKGFLKGQFGIVQNVEEKGDLRVVFGALTARVSLHDVEGRGPSPEKLAQKSKRR